MIKSIQSIDYFKQRTWMAKEGVYVCHYGLNIDGVVDMEKVTEYAKTLLDVVVAKHYSYLCSGPGQRMIQYDIRQEKPDRIVVASCPAGQMMVDYRRGNAGTAVGVKLSLPVLYYTQLLGLALNIEEKSLACT